MKIIPIIALSILLSGCGLFKKHEDPPVITTKPVNINKEALKFCAPLSENITVKTFEDTLIIYADLTQQYVECANKQATSVKLLKQIGNINE